ncbi:hypothetical protein DAI22_12g036301 [Oryza sativa Japonica Group]|nr:hypothetical protein DAI22_12g036301 [Oryza sativa Japonica Group]
MASCKAAKYKIISTGPTSHAASWAHPAHWAGESVQSHDAITPAPPHPHPTVNGAAAAGDRGGPPPPERQKPTIDSPASSIARFRYPHLRRTVSVSSPSRGRTRRRLSNSSAKSRG